MPAPTNPRVFPPVMRRGLSWIFALSIVFSLLALAWVIFRRPLGIPRGFFYRYGSFFFGLAPLLVIWPLWLLRTRHIRRALLESQGRLCTHCAYDVSQLPPSGTCPECGRPYDLEKDRPLWEAVGLRIEPDPAAPK